MSDKRRALFQKRALERELANMEKEDEKVDWEENKKMPKKAQLLSKEQIAEMMKPKKKADTATDEAAKKDEEEGKKVVLTAASSFDKRELAVKEEKPKEEKPATATKEKKVETKEEPASSTLDKKVEVKKELGPSNRELEKEKKDQKEKAAGSTEKPDWGSSSSSSSSSSSATTQPPEEKKAKKEPFDKRGSPAGSFDKRDPAGPVKGTQNASNTGKYDWRMKVNPSHRVAVDWFQTIRLKHGVPDSHTQALRRLTREGYELVLLSYCGSERAKQVREEAEGLDVNWTDIQFVSRKTGPQGKVARCKQLRCGYLFDDDDSILWEAEEGGLPYYAIQTYHNQHGWCNRTYRNLPAAIDAFLSS